MPQNLNTTNDENEIIITKIEQYVNEQNIRVSYKYIASSF